MGLAVRRRPARGEDPEALRVLRPDRIVYIYMYTYYIRIHVYVYIYIYIYIYLVRHGNRQDVFVYGYCVLTDNHTVSFQNFIVRYYYYYYYRYWLRRRGPPDYYYD